MTDEEKMPPMRVVDAVLRHTGTTQNNKRRAYMFYKNELPKIEPSTRSDAFAKFIKDLYGLGGSYPCYTEGDMEYSWDSCTGGSNKALTILWRKKDVPQNWKEDFVKLSWYQVAFRISLMIDAGTYMDAKDYVDAGARSELFWLAF